VETASGFAQRGMYYLNIDSFSCVDYTAASSQLWVLQPQKWLQLAPALTELTPVIKIIDLIPAGALTALNGASILRKFYYFHSLPQHPAILTLTPRKVAHEEGK